MTSPKDPIQSLIAEIDGILHKPGSRMPWPVSSEVAKQRQVLERVRDYLVLQQPKEKAVPSPQIDQPGQEIAQQIAQAVAKDMESLRANLMQPLLLELEALRKERESLVREIRQMENRVSHYHSLAQQQAKQQQIISDFLQVLMGRLQESLTQQVAKTMANLETQLLNAEYIDDQSQEEISNFPAYSEVEASTATGDLTSQNFPLHPQDRLEQLRQMQAQSDQILMNLDSTLRVVLEALQRNVMGYQESLSQGVAKMHSLGQESEVLFTAFVNHIAQQLGREVSSFMPAKNSAQTKVLLADAYPKGVAQHKQPVSAAAGSAVPAEQEDSSQSELSTESPAEHSALELRARGNSSGQLPFPGMEWPPQQQPRPEAQRRRGAEESNDSSSPQHKSTPAQEHSSPEHDSPLNPENWEVIKLDLETLGVEPIDSEEIDTILQLDIDSWISESPLAKERESGKDEEEPETGKGKEESLAPIAHHPSPTSKLGDGPVAGVAKIDDVAQRATEPEVALKAPGSLVVRKEDAQQSATSERISQELDDLYSLLFGSAVADTVEPDDFESLAQETAKGSATPFATDDLLCRGRDNPPVVPTEQGSRGESRSISPSSPPHDSHLPAADSLNLPDAQIEDALFAGLEEEMAAFTQSPSLGQPTLFPESWEDVLFYEDATPASTTTTKADFAPHSLSGDPEGVETIAVLTDLFDEKELRDVEEITFPDSVGEVRNTEKETPEETAFTPSPLEPPIARGNPESPLLRSDELGVLSDELKTSSNTQHSLSPQLATPPDPQHRQQIDNGFYTDVVEDSYIPAPPEENLLVTDRSESELDIKLLLELETLQLLSQDLFSFESFENQNVQVQKNPLGREDDSKSTPDQFGQSSSYPSVPLRVRQQAKETNPTSSSLSVAAPLDLTAPLQSDSAASAIQNPKTLDLAGTQGEPAPQQDQPPRATNELLAEDWDNSAGDRPKGEGASPSWAYAGATTESSVSKIEHTNLMVPMDLGLADSAHKAENIESDEQINNPQTHSQPDAGNLQNHAIFGSELGLDGIFLQPRVEEIEVGKRINLPATPSSISPELTLESHQVDWNPDIFFEWEDLNWELEGDISREEVFNNWILEEASTNFELPNLNFGVGIPGQESETIKSDEQIDNPKSHSQPEAGNSQSQALAQQHADLSEEESISSKITSQSHQVEWNPDLFALQDLNWDLEEGLGEGEEVFSNWILEEVDTDFVISEDFELETPSQDAKTIKSDKCQPPDSDPSGTDRA